MHWKSETSGTWGIKTTRTVNLQLVLLELWRPEQMDQKGQEAKVSALIDMAHLIKRPFQQNGAYKIFVVFWEIAIDPEKTPVQNLQNARVASLKA